jgi:hypothetical protein
MNGNKGLNIKPFDIKAITLFDCIEDKNLLPFSLIEKQSSNAYENMMAEMRDSPQDKSYIKYRDKYIQRYVYVAGKLVDDNMLKEIPEELKIYFFNTIIDKSFKLFKSLKKIPKDNAINLYFLAKEFGKMPIELICEKDKYNELDAYIFNNYCLYCGKELEAAQTRSMNSNIGKR